MKHLLQNSIFKYALAPVCFILILLITNTLFSSARLDLTEQNIYSLSDGTQNILENLEQEVEVILYYSDKASKDLTALRSYAKRVQELLAEYVILSDGKLSLTVIDPEPFSEAEDQAAEVGLQAIPIASGEEIYFGLSAQSKSGVQSIISFLQPDKEAFLEYQLTELVYRLGQSVTPVLGLMSNLDMRGGFDMQRGGSTPPWTVFEQLDQLYDVRWVSEELDEIESDIDLLMLVMPENLSQEATYALDQFVMGGGKLLLFMDPKAETAQPEPEGETNEQLDDALDKLLKSWGVDYVSDRVVVDEAYGLTISMGQGQPPVRHIGLLGVQSDGLNPNEVASAELEVVNFASSGVLLPTENAQSEFNALAWSSPYAQLMAVDEYNQIQDPTELQHRVSAATDSYILAARLSGAANSVFDAKPDAIESDAEFIKATEQLNVLVVADTDVLSDRLWVQVQNFFGQRVVQPWADNGAFAHNLVEQFLGSSDLINIRSRGRFSRPFEVVQDIQQKAQTQYLENERLLQQQLEQTEIQLAELETLRDKDTMMLSAEQEATLEQFQQEKLHIRKALRDVRHELGKDIEGLGSLLKVLNIAVAPILLVLLLLLIARRVLHKRH